MDLREAKKLKQRLAIEKAFGVGEITAAEWRAALGQAPAPAAKAAAPAAKPAPAASASQKQTSKSAAPAPAPAKSAPEKKAAAVVQAGKALDWDEAKTLAMACRNCRLCETRTNVVWGVGNEKAKLMFIGEAPGADEDEQGEPFVGRAGQLLTKIIEAMGLKREDVYIANILKCRPPDNRPPLPDESAACMGYLKAQIAAIKPQVICTLGKSASQSILETETPITKLRGKFQDYHGTKLMPTYHPAYLLRNPAEKKTVWEDMQQVMAVLGLPKK